jgi:hypothetical protein
MSLFRQGRGQKNVSAKEADRADADVGAEGAFGTDHTPLHGVKAEEGGLTAGKDCRRQGQGETREKYKNRRN